MSQIFHPAMNAFAKASIFGAVFIIGFAAWVLAGVTRSSYLTNEGIAKNQPVPFSHEHHVSGLGIDCRYCHTSVEQSSFAGIPPTKTCMTCHSQIWTNAQILQPVRDSWYKSEPIHWTRVNDLPDYVYFNHSIHIAKGVSCVTCHGQVNEMPLMYQAKSLQMEWCLQCHRDPAKFMRPKEQVFNMKYDLAKDSTLAQELKVTKDEAEKLRTQDAIGAKLVEQYHVHTEQLTNCAVCHR